MVAAVEVDVVVKVLLAVGLWAALVVVALELKFPALIPLLWVFLTMEPLILAAEVEVRVNKPSLRLGVPAVPA
jgi:hypothetical protein